MLRSALTGLIMLVFLAKAGWAYSDRVDAPAEEIYSAAKLCFEKEGLAEDHPEKNQLTTKWIHSRIQKSRRHLFSLKTKEHVLLRYKLNITAQPGRAYSDVSVNGRFEERPTDAPPQLEWRKSITSKELYFKEREAFFKILGCLENYKKTPTTQNPPTTA